jgi:hypothetical protein
MYKSYKTNIIFNLYQTFNPFIIIFICKGIIYQTLPLFNALKIKFIFSLNHFQIIFELNDET